MSDRRSGQPRSTAALDGPAFKPMRIVVAHNTYQQHGGEDSCVDAEIAMLKAYGHDVIPYVVSNNAVTDMSSVDLAVRTVWSRTAYRELRSLFRREKPDVVHFHNTFPLISPAAYYAARREGVPVVQTLHNHRLTCCNAVLFRDGRVCTDCLGSRMPWRGVVHACYRNSRLASLATASMIGFHRMVGTWTRAVNVFIALSQSSKLTLAKAGLDADRIVVKPNFVFPDPGIGPGGGGYCLYAGRLSAEKGLLTLINAWGGSNNGLSLMIVGDGPLRSIVEGAAKDNPNIKFVGRKEPNVVYDLMGQAEAVIIPSECLETFGRVAVEAFAKGTPVLAARMGGLEEIVEERRNGLLFEAGNIGDLAVKARLMLADPVRLLRMRASARRTFEDKYTVAGNHAQLMAIYRQARSARIIA